MTDKLLIGLGYRARSGKDTVGDYLRINQGFYPASFAHKLKCAVGAITEENAYDYAFKENMTCLGLTGGQALQQIGVKLREIDPQFWIRAAQLEYITERRPRVVVTDVRFLNEAAEIKRLGGLLVEVWRPGLPVDEHISEQEGRQIKWDYVLDNSGSLDQLYERVEAMLKWARGQSA